METEEVVVSDEVMEVLKRRSQKENVNLEDLIERYVQLISNLRESVPLEELKKIQRRNRALFGDADIDLKEEFANAMYKKYVG